MSGDIGTGALQLFMLLRGVRLRQRSVIMLYLQMDEVPLGCQCIDLQITVD
jgi:hypothetical protein